MQPEHAATGELVLLDPREVRLWRDRGSLPRMQLGDRVCYARVRIAYAFPLSVPGRYASFMDWNGKEIGMVERVDDLDEASRSIVHEELERRYFTPIITRVHKVRWLFGAVSFEVDTDRGPRAFDVKEHHSDIVAVGPRRYLIADADGNRYEIPDTAKLDPASYARIEGLV